MLDATLPAQAGERKRAPPPHRKPGQKNRVSSSTISLELRLAALASFNFVGAQKYLIKVAKTNPAAYLTFLAKCIKQDDGNEVAGLTIRVQQLVVAAGPVPGVLNSPVIEHMAPQRLLAANGVEVIDG